MQLKTAVLVLLFGYCRVFGCLVSHQDSRNLKRCHGSWYELLKLGNCCILSKWMCDPRDYVFVLSRILQHVNALCGLNRSEPHLLPDMFLVYRGSQ